MGFKGETNTNQLVLFPQKPMAVLFLDRILFLQTIEFYHSGNCTFPVTFPFEVQRKEIQTQIGRGFEHKGLECIWGVVNHILVVAPLSRNWKIAPR